MCPVVRRTRKIKLRLDADLYSFDFALFWHLPRPHPRFRRIQSYFFANFFTKLSKGQSALRFLGFQVPAAQTIFMQTPRNLAPPFGFGLSRFDFAAIRRDRRRKAQTFFNGDLAKRAFFGIFEQESATLRADAYHRSFLRCGSSSGTRGMVARHYWFGQRGKRSKPIVAYKATHGAKVDSHFGERCVREVDLN